VIVGRLAGFALRSSVMPDSALNRTFSLDHVDYSANELRAHDQRTFDLLGRTPIEGLFCDFDLCPSLIRWGADGLAFNNTQTHKVYLVRSCLVRCADLSVALVANPDPPVFESNVIFTVTVSNLGRDDAPD